MWTSLYTFLNILLDVLSRIVHAAWKCQNHDKSQISNKLFSWQPCKIDAYVANRFLDWKEMSLVTNLAYIFAILINFFHYTSGQSTFIICGDPDAPLSSSCEENIASSEVAASVLLGIRRLFLFFTSWSVCIFYTSSFLRLNLGPFCW